MITNKKMKTYIKCNLTIDNLYINIDEIIIEELIRRYHVKYKDQHRVVNAVPRFTAEMKATRLLLKGSIHNGVSSTNFEIHKGRAALNRNAQNTTIGGTITGRYVI